MCVAIFRMEFIFIREIYFWRAELKEPSGGAFALSAFHFFF